MLRLKTVLLLNKTYNTAEVAAVLNVSYSFAAKWRNRAEQLFLTWPTTPTDTKERWQLLCNGFSDAPRSGSPATYTRAPKCVGQFDLSFLNHHLADFI